MPPTAPRSPRPTSNASGRKDRLSADPDILFVYGSLQFPDVLSALIDRIPHHTPATAHGWRAAALPGLVYPGLTPAQGHSAKGLLITDLTPAEWQTIDAFENPGYDLHRLDVDHNRHGWAYICGPDVKVLTQDWSAELFAHQHLPAYITNCRAWRRRYHADNPAI
jgi:gamma-glutamylcyclotransferase (GGCT)/AIG2-like uncharacterized protein YtfP